MKKSEKLNNSLIFISDSNKTVSTVCFGLYFRVGSINENENNCGITHLIEHLFFRRLNNIGNRELYHKMESLGGTIRGYTTRRYVCFELQVLRDFVSPAFDLMNEFLSPFEWTDGEIEIEKQIILNEMAQIGNDVDYLSADQTSSNIFLFPIKGTPNSLQSITKAQVNDWKIKYFNCSNCCLIVTGNVDDDILSGIKLSLKSHERALPVPKIDIMPKVAFRRIESGHLFSDGNENYADVFIFFDLDLQNMVWTEVLVAFDIFCNGDGSKLSFAMKDELGWVYEIDSEITHYGKYGSIKISWSIANDHLVESLNLFFDLLKILKSEITTEEFESSINFSTLNMQVFKDNPLELNRIYGYYDYVVGSPISIENCIEKRNTITVDDMSYIANKIFTKNNMFVEIDFNKNEISEEQLKQLIAKVKF